MKMTLQQIKAACGLLEIDQKILCSKTGISPKQMSNFWGKRANLSAQNIGKIEDYLVSQGIEFGDNSVKKKDVFETPYVGQQGLRNLMDEIYEYARDVGGTIYLVHLGSGPFGDWAGKEWLSKHIERMTAIKDQFDLRIFHEENTHQRLGKDYAEYRWLSRKHLTDRTSYIFGNKVCLFYREDPLRIRVIHDSELAEYLRGIHDIVWKTARLPEN